MTNYAKFQPLLTSSFSEIETTKKEFMYRKKILICKYHLKDKCKFGGKCNFLHIQMKEIEQNLEEVSKLRSENLLLKTEFYKIVQENRKLKLNESTNASNKAYRVHALQKVKEKNYDENFEKKATYSSLFKEKRVSQRVELGNKKSRANESNIDQASEKNLTVIRKEIRNPNIEQIRSANALKSTKKKENSFYSIEKLKQGCYYVREKIEQQEKSNRQSEQTAMNLIKSLQREQKSIVERMERNKRKAKSENYTNKDVKNEILNKIKEMDGRIDACSLGLVNLAKSTDKFSEKTEKIMEIMLAWTQEEEI
jgi:hypothetical protein